MPKSSAHKSSFFLKHWPLLVLLILILSLIAYFFFRHLFISAKLASRQATLQPFYAPPNPLPSGKPGDIIRQEKLNIPLPANATGYRILYRSELSDSTPTVSSGMIFIPSTPAPTNGRPIVAWAHGTSGMGLDCAPSRTPNPISNMTWLSEMLSRGFIVTATDYSGLGTPGIERYLIGPDEARDVLNSVRAAQNLSIANGGNSFALWGHSQGGHSVLFAANLAPTYTPELKLVAVAAAAPAAELLPLLSQQYQTAVAWLIGPEIVTSWPLQYPSLPIPSVITTQGIKNTPRLAQSCILGEVEEAILRSDFKQKYFQIDPAANPIWYATMLEQTAPILKPQVPLFIAQGLIDTVVLPNTTALYAKKACLAGSNLTLDWMGQVNHDTAAAISGPLVASWLQDRFQGNISSNTCDQPLPVEPANIPPSPI